MKNIKSFSKYVNEAVEVYAGYRDNDGNIVELDDEPTYVWPYAKEKNLSGANLERKFFRHAQMDGYEIRHASFRKADLTAANLTGSDLTGSIFAGANVEFCDFTDAILTDTTGWETCENIQSARFYGADLSGIDSAFFDRILKIYEENTKWENNTYGLISWQHEGPNPTDETPIEVFLQGCKGEGVDRIMAEVRRSKKSKNLFGI